MLVLAGLMAFALSACGGGSSSKSGGTISSAGATFPQPVYDEWGNNLKKNDGVTVNYNPVGSGGGIAQFTAGTVDFGTTDAAMKDEEVSAVKKKGESVHVPTVFGAVTVSYNLSGINSGLKIDGPTLANIFLGKITAWADPAITSLNPGLKLPSTKITVIHRSDESGTTKLFTTYLGDYSKTWTTKVGVDKTVKWPTGTGAKGNAGVAGGIQQTPGAIGYVELAYALQNNFTTASLKNASGRFVQPNLDSTSAAGDGLKVPVDLRFSAINSPNAAAYPIASATFMLVYQDMCKAGISQATAKNVVSLLNYGLGTGQDVAKQLSYAPLPAAILSQGQTKVDGLQCNAAALKG